MTSAPDTFIQSTTAPADINANGWEMTGERWSKDSDATESGRTSQLSGKPLEVIYINRIPVND